LNYDEGYGSKDNSIYGRSYNWKTALRVCPSGWHLPDNAEWETLINFVGSGAGTKLKAKSGWDNKGNGTDDYGFSALPGGTVRDKYVQWAGEFGYWWGANDDGALNAWYWKMSDEGNAVVRGSANRPARYSVRCIKDS
jgi:uncharacterized protein (TIGR02145 family)